MVAFYSAVIPMVVDLWHAPDPRTTWLWLATIGTCLLSIYGAERRDLGHTIVPWGAVLSNMFLAVLSVR